MDDLDILRSREEEVGREWEWLHDVIHRVAHVRAQQGETQMFRILQEQARLVATDDAREGMTAVFSRRHPTFHGR